VTIETGSSDEIRSGFIVAHTDAPDDGSTRIQGTWKVMYEAPENELGDYWMAGGIMKFYEQVTHGTLRMFVIFAKATLDYNNREP